MPKTLSFMLCAFVLGTFQRGQAQDFWQQTAGPTGGSVLSLTTTAGGLVVAGTRGGGVFVSNDDGMSWSSASEGLENKRVYSLIALPGSILAGTWGGGVFRSTDNGLSWVQSGLDGSLVRSFAYEWPGSVFAGAGTVYRSSNEGEEWEQTTFDPPGVINAMLALSAETILAGTEENGILKTTDAGDSWSDASSGLEGRSVHALAFSGSGWVLAGTDAGVFRSTNEGSAWIQMTSDSAVLSLVLDSQGLNYAGTESGKILRSFNDGASWDDVSIDTPVAPVLSLGTGPLMSVVAGFEHAGIFRTISDGELWTNGNSGLVAMDVTAIAASESVYAGTQFNGVLVSTDNGASWEERNSGLDNRFIGSLLIRPNGDLFAGTLAGVYRSTDDGNSWHLRTTGITDSTIEALAQTSSGTLFAGAWGDDGLFRSTNEGMTWTVSNNGIPVTNILSIRVDQLDRILAGTTSGAYRSTDNGDSWNYLGGNLSVRDIGVNSHGHIFLADEADFNVGRLTRTTDDGQTWDFPLNGIAPIHTIAIEGSDVMHVGTNDGVLVSTDFGDTWTDESTGLGNATVWEMATDAELHLWAATLDNGTFRSTSPITSVETETSDLPAEFRLEQNYPNPFNSISNFEFHLPAKSSFATLKIYDLLGQEVTTILAETLDQGNHKRQWDATGYPSGIYFYRLQAGDFVETRKLVLLK